MICWEDGLNPANCHPERSAMDAALAEQQRMIALVREELAAEKWQRPVRSYLLTEMAKTYTAINPAQWDSMRIRALRITKSLTRDQLAARLECKSGAVESWERGWSEPDAGMIERLVAIEQERRVG